MKTQSIKCKSFCVHFLTEKFNNFEINVKSICYNCEELQMSQKSVTVRDINDKLLTSPLSDALKETRNLKCGNKTKPLFGNHYECNYLRRL